MKHYFARLLRALVNRDYETSDDQPERSGLVALTSGANRAMRGISRLKDRDDGDNDLSARIDFTLSFYYADGGMVVRVGRPFSDHDEPSRLYIVQDNASLGEELSKIITMERMRK